MFRAASVLVLVIAFCLVARGAHAQVPPGWSNGGLTATLPPAEQAPSPAAAIPSNPHWFDFGWLRAWTPTFAMQVLRAPGASSAHSLRAIRERRAMRF